MNKLSSFVDQFIATVKGDNAKSDAIKTQRQVVSALKTQISHMEGDTVTLEQNVEDAKEALKKATINNGEVISDSNGRDSYITNLIRSKNAVSDSEDALEVHLETISFLKETLENAK